MQMPPMNLNSTTSSRSGDIMSTIGDKVGSALNINYGGGDLSSTSALNFPWYVWAGAGFIVLFYIKKKA